MKKFLLMALLAISAMSCSTDDSVLGVTEGKSQVATENMINTASETNVSKFETGLVFKVSHVDVSRYGAIQHIACKNKPTLSGDYATTIFIATNKGIYTGPFVDENNTEIPELNLTKISSWSLNAMAYGKTYANIKEALYVITVSGNIYKKESTGNFIYCGKAPVLSRSMSVKNNLITVLTANGDIYRALIKSDTPTLLFTKKTKLSGVTKQYCLAASYRPGSSVNFYGEGSNGDTDFGYDYNSAIWIYISEYNLDKNQNFWCDQTPMRPITMANGGSNSAYEFLLMVNSQDKESTRNNIYKAVIKE